ncbi:MAG: 3-deoxy-D-manno-octulosonic-acid transferase [Paraglaciecola sp.]|jgi:3-deoxy-D-manno-octulosonic-acid transferase
MPQNYRPSLRQEITRWAYSCLLFLLLPILLAHFGYRCLSRHPDYSRKRAQRFALCMSAAQSGGILIHCVSVGEVVAAANVVKALRVKQPTLPITLTTTTATGAQRVLDLFGSGVAHCYLPYDLPFMMQRLLDVYRPAQVLITEVELWPNLIHQCWRSNIPVSVINARMTEKSARAYGKISPLFTPMLMKLSAICAQGQRDFNNYLALGAPQNTLFLTNNIKFAQQPDAQTLDISAQLVKKFNLQGRTILVAGSTHEPEESMLLDAYQALRVHQPDLLLIIVPRHPQRFDAVYGLCLGSGLNCARSTSAPKDTASIQILLVDQMGLLQGAYALAHVAFVGGSIADRGGHNALEPGAFSVPVIMGPHTYNNPEICQALATAGALETVLNAQDIGRQVGHWLTDKPARITAGLNAQQVLKNNSGAVDATLSILQL